LAFLNTLDKSKLKIQVTSRIMIKTFLTYSKNLHGLICIEEQRTYKPLSASRAPFAKAERE
jgi:hypothetical protein